MAKKRWWKVCAVVSFLVWVIGLAGLPDDARRWWAEWLPPVADFFLAHFQWLANACVVALVGLWLHDSLGAKLKARGRVRSSRPVRRPPRPLGPAEPAKPEDREEWKGLLLNRPKPDVKFYRDITDLPLLRRIAARGLPEGDPYGIRDETVKTRAQQVIRWFEEDHPEGYTENRHGRRMHSPVLFEWWAVRRGWHPDD